MAEKVKRRQAKEMEIARRVWMGEDYGTVQEEYESEPSTYSDGSNRSKEEESELGDTDSFMVKPRGTMGSRIPVGSRTSASTPKARKRIGEDDVTLMEEVKQAQVEKYSGMLQMPSPLERHEDELGRRTSPKACLMVPVVIDPPRDLQDAVCRESVGSALVWVMRWGMVAVPAWHLAVREVWTSSDWMGVKLGGPLWWFQFMLQCVFCLFRFTLQRLGADHPRG
jgi:hypothetical protein